jgi:hypothetical protein
MKVSTIAVLLLASSFAICHSDAFAFSVISHTRSNPKAIIISRGVPLAAEKSTTNNYNKAADNVFNKGAASFVAAAAIGWGVAISSAGAFETTPVFHSSFAADSTSVTLSAEYADFSMPSYRDALDAPIMTNLKGRLDLFVCVQIGTVWSCLLIIYTCPSLSRREDGKI